jgi:hypothetical protein
VHALETVLMRPTADCPQNQQAGRVEAAQLAALAWLAHVDSGDLWAVWTHCSGLFRDTIDRSAWEKTLQTWRAPLGSTCARTLHAAKLTRSIPAAPLGEYVLLQFKTQFACSASAVETVTLLKDQDNTWRVSGYYFK